MPIGFKILLNMWRDYSSSGLKSNKNSIEFLIFRSAIPLKKIRRVKIRAIYERITQLNPFKPSRAFFLKLQLIGKSTNKNYLFRNQKIY